MKKAVLFLGTCFVGLTLLAQSVSLKLQTAFQQFEKDSQMRHALISLYVIDSKSGEIVFDKNSQIGLAPASTQKVITSITAFELLGSGYRYKTELSYSGKIEKQILKGNIYVIGSGDPTLGSSRYLQTSDTIILNKWVTAIKNKQIKKIEGLLLANTNDFEHQTIPDGWTWEDVGNYYGAGTHQLNWRENLYELTLQSANKLNGDVTVVDKNNKGKFVNELKAAAKGTGDNAYIYYDNSLKGTIPMNEDNFIIRGANKNPTCSLLMDFSKKLSSKTISTTPKCDWDLSAASIPVFKLHTHHSPSLDSIVYWFNKKSINLYGEALIKTFALEKKQTASTNNGLTILKDFWKKNGIEETELNMYDGSGLSPENRITTHAQVSILKYAQDKKWYPFFYNSLPLYNNMTMKSGTIGDVKGFCGYHRSADGHSYVFSFLVNNYSGSTSALVTKMYAVLNELK